ncbi:MAG TPA: hypothetical protein VJ654_14190 [Noviherbaspirillum sp.]|nr:hypothetical protein [Noviherbaspirillum sp.]
MWNRSHETWVDCLKRYIKAWKMRGPAGDGSTGHWSDETICDFIVEAHVKIGGPAKTGIVFNPAGAGDESKRRKANAMKIMRYLTDEPNTEFESLQLFNLAPSILAAMPEDLRTGFLNEYISMLNLSVSGIETAGTNRLNATAHLVEIAKETSEAEAAVAELISSPTSAHLVEADRELAEAEEAIHSARIDVRRQMNIKAVG